MPARWKKLQQLLPVALIVFLASVDIATIKVMSDVGDQSWK
jgi:hypothetical protein